MPPTAVKSTEPRPVTTVVAERMGELAAAPDKKFLTAKSLREQREAVLREAKGVVQHALKLDAMTFAVRHAFTAMEIYRSTVDIDDDVPADWRADFWDGVFKSVTEELRPILFAEGGE